VYAIGRGPRVYAIPAAIEATPATRTGHPDQVAAERDRQAERERRRALDLGGG
jgi:hypothetical protein